MQDEPKRVHHRRRRGPDLRVIPPPPPSPTRAFQGVAIELALMIARLPPPQPRVPGTSVLSGMTW